MNLLNKLFVGKKAEKKGEDLKKIKFLHQKGR